MNTQLTPTGTRRRQEMRHELISYMKLHHRRRRWSRSALGLLFLIGTASLSCLVLSNPVARDIQPPFRTSTGGNDVSVEVAPPKSIFQLVNSNPASLERYRCRPQSLIQTLNDEELLAQLAELHRPCGLIRQGGEARLISLTSGTPLTTDDATKPPSSNQNLSPNNTL